MDAPVDPARDFLYSPRGHFRGLRIPKPKVPWQRRPPRAAVARTSCGNKSTTWRTNPTGQQIANWWAKNCGPKKAARDFAVGGPESGTLAGARRAEGLFDWNWGTDFPLTRKEQLALQNGTPIPDPFFSPPTDAPAGNWIADKMELLRRRMRPVEYSTALDINKLCGPGGSGITCEGPDGGVSWSSERGSLTKEDQARFREAYCGPNQCVTPGRVAPPAGFTERAIIAKPRNPGTAGKTGCRVAPIVPVLSSIPIAPVAPATPPAVDWTCAASDLGCVGANCVVHGQDRTMHWRSGVPGSVLQAWWQANCSAEVI